MPTYEYLCVKCGKFEDFQSITAKPLEKCPKCGGPVSRVISAGGGMIFKGSGFYSTDYRNSDYAKRVKEEKGGGAVEKPAAPSPAGAPAQDGAGAQKKGTEPSGEGKVGPVNGAAGK